MAIRREGDGISLALRVTPKASADRIQGLMACAGGVPDGFESRLKIQVTAPPVEGAANHAVIKLLAKALKLPKTSLTVTSGAADRNKVLHIACDDPRELEHHLRTHFEIYGEG